MYTYGVSSPTVFEEMGEDLLLAAAKFKIGGLREKAEASLCQTLSSANVSARVLLADQNECPRLLRASTAFAVS